MTMEPRVLSERVISQRVLSVSEVSQEGTGRVREQPAPLPAPSDSSLAERVEGRLEEALQRLLSVQATRSVPISARADDKWAQLKGNDAPFEHRRLAGAPPEARMEFHVRADAMAESVLNDTKRGGPFKHVSGAAVFHTPRHGIGSVQVHLAHTCPLNTVHVRALF